MSKWNAFDFVVTVAFGSVLATTLLSTDVSLGQGTIGLGLLIVWQFLLTWLSVRSHSVQQWVKGHPTLLLWDGEFKKAAMRKERVTEGEIRAAIRSNGGMALEEVSAVVLETDGTFSVLMKSNEDNPYSALSDVQGF